MITTHTPSHMTRERKLQMSKRRIRRPIEADVNPFRPLTEEEMDAAIERIDHHVAKATAT